jgi:hypothetical protein
MAQTNLLVGIHTIAVPSNARRITAASGPALWELTVALCFRPRVFGPVGEYALFKDIPGLKDLPKILNQQQFELSIGGNVTAINLPLPSASTLPDSSCWRWSEGSFIELLPNPNSITIARVKTLNQSTEEFATKLSEKLPGYFPSTLRKITTYDRAAMCKLVVSSDYDQKIAGYYSGSLATSILSDPKGSVNDLAEIMKVALRSFNKNAPRIPPSIAKQSMLAREFLSFHGFSESINAIREKSNAPPKDGEITLTASMNNDVTVYNGPNTFQLKLKLPKSTSTFPNQFNTALRNMRGAIVIIAESQSLPTIDKSADSWKVKEATKQYLVSNALMQDVLLVPQGAEVSLSIDVDSSGASRWKLDAKPIDVKLDETINGHFSDHAVEQGARLICPLIAADGDRFTACNRDGKLIVSVGNSQQSLRLIPQGLIKAASNQFIEFPEDFPIIATYKNGVWTLVPETTDEEFHRNIAGLDHHPELAKKAGLIREFKLKLTDEQMRRLDKLGVLSLTCKPTLSAKVQGADLAFFLQKTSFQQAHVPNSDLWEFLPRQKNENDQAYDYVAGMLKLDRCETNQFELDLPVRVITEQVISASRQEGSGNPGDIKQENIEKGKKALSAKTLQPEDSQDVLMALSEVGIEIIHPKAADQMQSASTRANYLHALSLSYSVFTSLSGTRGVSCEQVEEPLYLEDLTLGHRFDVFAKQQNIWRALNPERRELWQTVNGSFKATGEEIVDEGITTASVVGEATQIDGNGALQRVARLSQVVHRWNEFSSFNLKQKAEAASSSLPGGLGLAAIQVNVKGMRPKLRIARDYQFRARLTDIAGNGWSLIEATTITNALDDPRTPKLVTKPVTAFRYQTVKVPKVTLPAELGAKEVRVLVIRSFDQRKANPRSYGLYAPRVSFELMTRLGVTDGFNSADRSNFISRTVARMQKQAINNADAAQGLLANQAQHLEIEDPDAIGAAFRFLPGSEAPKTSLRRNALKQNNAESFLHRTNFNVNEYESTTVPYATGKLPSGGSYPCKPSQIILKHDEQSSHRVRGCTLEICLPPGESQLVLVSSAIRPESLEHFGLLRGLRKTLTESNTASDSLLASGASPLLTPYISLLLVHATQRPVTAPILTLKGSSISPKTKLATLSNCLGPREIHPAIKRQYGQLEVELSFDCELHEESTSRIDIEANWTEKIDFANRRVWFDTKNNESVQFWATSVKNLEEQLEKQRGLEAKNIAPRVVIHKLKDTRRRTIFYTAVGTSRYVEYYNRHDLATVKAENKAIDQVAGLYAENTDPYLMPEDFRRASKPIKVEIPNSLEPSPFEIEYVLPMSMVKDTEGQNGNVSSSDVCRAVRVYFRRPAFTSGDEEMLGVLVSECGDAKNSVPQNDDEADAVSELSEDPLSFSKPITEAHLKQLTSDFFPNPDEPARTVVRLPAKELPISLKSKNVPVRKATVLGYKIRQVPDEDLLYADIAIQGTERAAPFLRLALVRYQPLSVEGAHISNRPAIAWVRPSADRAVNVKFERVNGNPFSTHRKMTVLVTGPCGTDDKGNPSTQMIGSIKTDCSVFEYPNDVVAPVSFSATWLDVRQSVAQWMYQADVRLYGVADVDAPKLEFQPTVLAIEERNQFSLSELVWFSTLNLGNVRHYPH